jgi:hypothetical protein
MQNEERRMQNELQPENLVLSPILHFAVAQFRADAILQFAFFILHLDSPRSSVRSERHRAKVEAAGAIPAVDAIFE